MDITKLTQALSLSLSNDEVERKQNAVLILQVIQSLFKLICFKSFIIN